MKLCAMVFEFHQMPMAITGSVGAIASTTPCIAASATKNMGLLSRQRVVQFLHDGGVGAAVRKLDDAVIQGITGGHRRRFCCGPHATLCSRSEPVAAESHGL